MWDRAQQALIESMTRLLSQVASLLPGIVALFVALLISAFIAWVVAVVLRRSLIPTPASKASRTVTESLS